MSDIRCENCNKKIAEGEKPDKPLTIKCRKCGHINDISKPDTTKPFAERLPIEKK